MMSQSTVSAIVLLGLVGSAQLISGDPVPGVPSQANSAPFMGMNLQPPQSFQYGGPLQQLQPGYPSGNFPAGTGNMAGFGGFLPQQPQQQLQPQSLLSMSGTMNNNGMDLNGLLDGLFRNLPQMTSQAMATLRNILARLFGNQQMPLDPSQAQRLFQNPGQMGMGYGQFPNNFQQPMRQGGMLDLSSLLRPVSNALSQNPLTAPVASTLDNVSGGLQRTLSNTLSPQQGQQPSSPQSPSGSGSNSNSGR